MKNTKQPTYHSHHSGKGNTSTGGLRLPVCPNCGKRMNPLVAWLYKTKGEYCCPACGIHSNVVADPKTPGFGAVAVAISVVILLLFLFVFGGINLLGILLILVPFFLFTLLSPFLVRLQKMPSVPQSVKEQIPQRPAHPRVDQRNINRYPPYSYPPSSRSVPRATPPAYRQSSPSRPNYTSRTSQARPAQNPAVRAPQARPPQHSSPVIRSEPTAQNRPPVSSRPPASNHPPTRPSRTLSDRPKLFDTAEFGTRAPRDFSHYQDK